MCAQRVFCGMKRALSLSLCLGSGPEERIDPELSVVDASWVDRLWNGGALGSKLAA